MTFRDNRRSNLAYHISQQGPAETMIAASWLGISIQGGPDHVGPGGGSGQGLL